LKNFHHLKEVKDMIPVPEGEHWLIFSTFWVDKKTLQPPEICFLGSN